MNKKSKGIAAERELIHKFWKEGWAAIRIAGSGSTKYPSPDVLAGNNLRKIAIECKVTSSTKQYFSNKEIKELKEFSKIFGAEAWVGIKFNRDKWYFFHIMDLENTGANFAISHEKAKIMGLLFEDFIG